MRSDGSVAVKKRKKAERERTEQNKIDEKFMSAAMTKKVLREAQAQQDELAEEDAGSGASGAAFAPPEAGAAGWENQGGDGGSEMEEADGEEGEDEDEEMVTIDGDYVQGLGAGSGLSAEDEALAAFLGDGFLRKRTLGEIIREKLEEQVRRACPPSLRGLSAVLTRFPPSPPLLLPRARRRGCRRRSARRGRAVRTTTPRSPCPRA